MQNVSELLDKVVELQEIAGRRATELYYAEPPSTYNGYLYNASPDKYEFNIDSIDVTLEESCREPERTTVTISINQLEMSDEKWAKYIESVKENTARVMAERQRKKQESDLERKKHEINMLQNQIESLKKNLEE